MVNSDFKQDQSTLQYYYFIIGLPYSCTISTLLQAVLDNIINHSANIMQRESMYSHDKLFPTSNH